MDRNTTGPGCECRLSSHGFPQRSRQMSDFLPTERFRDEDKHRWIKFCSQGLVVWLIYTSFTSSPRKSSSPNAVLLA